MPVFTTAVTATPAAAAAAAYYSFHTGSSRPARLREKRTSTTSAVYSPIGLIVASNTPVATTSTTPQPHDYSTTAASPTCALDTAWSTAPTVGSAYYETVALGPAQGQILIETYPLDGQGAIAIPKSTFLVGWNFGGNAASALAVTIIYEE
jgi:hypothetical protein